MAESGRNSKVSLSDCGGVPSGLNRIRTRRASSRDSLSFKPDELIESRTWGVSKPPLNQKQKLKNEARGSGKIRGSSKKDIRKGKKLSSWFTSYLYKDSSQATVDIPLKNEEADLDVKALDWEALRRSAAQINENGTNGKKNLCSTKVSKGIKSFSHELGPRGGISPVLQRAHSFNDLKELIGSLHSRFDTAKEVVNAELAMFVVDVMDILGKFDPSSEQLQRKAEELLILAQQCVEMTSAQFRSKCEIIVQDLTEKRQQCQSGMHKWLLTRMLFILTRCTRILQFQKDKEPIDERSLNKFRKCIESIPAVEISWEASAGIGGSGPDYDLNQKSAVELATQENEKLSSCSEISYFRSGPPVERIEKTPGFKTAESRHSVCEKSENEPGPCIYDADLVICRICEETVPTTYLESHSYICAYADKCDLNTPDIDDRLLKLAEILEQIIESRNPSFHALCGSPENLKSQTGSASVSEGLSPKMSEWRKKGVEGMFEDIHEMDTAFIDESLLSSIMKGNLGMKLGNHGAPSSTGSMTSLSSTSTPRAGHFDSFWLEINNPSELEDVRQMIDLADIARCVVSTDISQEGSSEFLLACMQDLQDVLQHSKLKALVIDTFGGRIEKLLREKYILACDLIDGTSPKYDSSLKDGNKPFPDNGSQGNVLSTPLFSSHKDRTSIDDFEIIKPISRGAFGKVYLARKRTTGDLFAIKVLKKLDMIRKNDIDRILAERNILITVRNPFVVRFFYSFTCQDNLYLVMEYLNGGDLYSLLRKVGCLEEDVARIYLAELVLALEYLHYLGIVHRDLKPDNILIAHDGHIKSY